jgi:hypothetical protein
VALNDVVALDENRFYATNDHGFSLHKHGVTAQVLVDFLGIKTGCVHAAPAQRCVEC